MINRDCNPTKQNKMKKVFENDELVIEMEDNAFVIFKDVTKEDLNDNYSPDAEIAVQNYLDGNSINAEAGRGYVYNEDEEFGICVPISYK